MIDADLRAKLTEALLSTREWRTSAEGGWAADLTDALMPVVREALAAAWEHGHRTANPVIPDTHRDVINPAKQP